MEIEFKKVEINSGIFLKLEYSESKNGRKTKFKTSADAPIHPDLQDAIQALVPHFVLLTEMKKKSEVAKVIDLKELPEDLLSKFKATSLTIEDNKGDISYKISGYKILNTGKTVGFESPKVRLMASEEEKYDFINELEQAVDLIKEEALEYMAGKEATRTQTAMDFGEDFDPEVDAMVNQVDSEEFAA